MGEIVNRYPLDYSGDSANNAIKGEQHTLPDGENRTVMPDYAPFYTDSLVVKEVDSGDTLEVETDYLPVMYYEEPSIRSGLEVCGAIVVTNPEVESEIEIEYQALGGPYWFITYPLSDLIEDLDIDDREVEWGDMLGKPDFYPPVDHLHHLQDIRGFEYLTDVLEKINQAISYGDDLHLEKYNRKLQDAFDSLLERINTHKSSDDHDDRYVEVAGDTMDGSLTLEDTLTANAESTFNELSTFSTTSDEDGDGNRIALDVVQDALIQNNLIVEGDGYFHSIVVEDAASSRESLNVMSTEESQGFSVAMAVAL